VEKLVWVVWDRRRRAERRTVLLDTVAPALLEAGAVRLGIDVADDDAKVPSPTPFPLGEPRPTGLVNAWVEDAAVASRLTAVLTDAGLEVAGYRVEASVPTDYGDNAHHGPRDWPDGVRSPGLVTVNLLERPKGHDRDAWLRHWYERMGPVSGAIQPRCRYVRNLVVERLTPDAPPWDAIVEEGWPSADTLRHPRRFYGARSTWELVRNQLAILRVVMGFVRIWRVTTVPMSEYFVRTDGPEPR
jgi:hypothetical protein